MRFEKTAEIRHGSGWVRVVRVFPLLFRTPRMRVTCATRVTCVMREPACTKKDATYPDHPDPPGPTEQFQMVSGMAYPVTGDTRFWTSGIERDWAGFGGIFGGGTIT